MFTNNSTVDVGRGAVQLPNLIGISDRAPYLHDGCAQGLAGRFNVSCGGANHGGSFTFEEQADVIQYMESL
jgi:hypothetical protein